MRRFTRLCWSKVKSSKVSENLRIIFQILQASQQTGSRYCTQIENDIQLAQTRLTDLKAVIATKKEAELAALEQAAANSPVQLSQVTYEGYLQHSRQWQ